MKRLLWLALLFATPMFALDQYSGWCERGNKSVSVQGLTSSTKVQQSYYNTGTPSTSCKIFVYEHDTITLATIYSDNLASPTPLSNPFYVNTDGSFQLFAAQGRYDIVGTVNGVTIFSVNDVSFLDPADMNISILNGDVYLDQCATGGAGTSGNPWTGWESCYNNLASGRVAAARSGYFLNTVQLSPTADATVLRCSGWGTHILYNGSSWQGSIDTFAKNAVDGCWFQIGDSALGSWTIQHETSNSEANHHFRDIFISTSTGHHNYGQIGVQLENHSAGGSNYQNVLDIQTLFIDIPVQSVSTVSSNSPNANTVKIRSNGHRFAVDLIDGTDWNISGVVTGAYSPISTTAVTPSPTGATTYAYEVVYVVGSGDRYGSFQRYISNGFASLDVTHTNTVTWTAPTYGPTPTSYQLYRNVGGTTLGKIATVNPATCTPTCTVIDNGLVGDGSDYVPVGVAVNLAGSGGGGTGDYSSTIYGLVTEQGTPSIGVWQHAGSCAVSPCGIGVNVSDSNSFNEFAGVRDDTNAMQTVVETKRYFQKGVTIGNGVQPLQLFATGNLGPQILFTNSFFTQTWGAGISGAPGVHDFLIGDSTASTQPFYIKHLAPTNSLYIAADGKVGLGTNSPANVLDVAGTINATTGLKANGTAGLSVTKTVKGSDGNNCNLVFSFGLLTSTTCP